MLEMFDVCSLKFEMIERRNSETAPTEYIHEIVDIGAVGGVCNIIKVVSNNVMHEASLFLV